MMIRKLFIVLTGLALLAGAAVAADPRQPFLPYYWISGEVTKGGLPAENRIVAFYKPGMPGEVRAVSDINGKYALNVYELLYYNGVDINFTDAYAIAVYRGWDDYGRNPESLSLDAHAGFVVKDLDLRLGEGPLPGLTILNSSLPHASVGIAYAATLEAAGGTMPYTWSIVSGNLPPGLSLNAATGLISGTPTTRGAYPFTVRVADASGAFDEQNLEIDAVYAILDIAYGPQISPEVFFQALVGDTGTSQRIPQVVRVEARTGPDAAHATTVVGYADVLLDKNGNTTGRNGFLRPDGTEFSPGPPMPDGSYYLAVKQWLTPTIVGANHLSVITSRTIRLATVAGDRDASTTPMDLTQDPSVTYSETPYTPTGRPDAMLTRTDGRTVMRAGNMNGDEGNQYIDVIDTSHWYRLFTKFNTGAPDDPADPYIRADLDQNGLVDVVDTSWWYGTFSSLVLELGDPGPHGYVP